MAKVTGPLMSIGAGGVFGGVITVQKKHRGHCMYYSPGPTDRRTTDQLSQRSEFSDASVGWNSLSPVEQSVWNADAPPKFATGYNFYLSEYLLGNLPLIPMGVWGNKLWKNRLWG